MAIEGLEHAFFVIVSAIPMVFAGYFLVKTIMFFGYDPDCTHAHLDWDLALGLFLFTLFLVGTLSLAWRRTALQIACVALLMVTIFLITVVIVSISLGRSIPKDSKPMMEYYRLESYPLWAQKFLLKDNDLGAFQNCIIEGKLFEDFDKEELIRGGCCTPPIYCGFQQKNQTWLIAESELYSNDANCLAWSNEKGKLCSCYSRNTCKASYIKNLAVKW